MNIKYFTLVNLFLLLVLFSTVFSYTLTSSTVIKDLTSNTLSVTLFTHPPLPSTVNSSDIFLGSHQDSLSLTQSVITASSVYLAMEVKSHIAEGDSLVIGVTGLASPWIQVPIKQVNRHEVSRYSDYYYQWYTVEIIMVWLYIFFTITISVMLLYADIRVFETVTSLFTVTVLSWVVVEGQQLYSLLLLPLRNLRYIFGFNLHLQQGNIFTYCNIGLGMLLLPGALYVLVHRMTHVSPQTKILTLRFIRYDLWYYQIFFEGCAVTQGLASTQYTHLSSLGIIGIVVGCLYLLLMVIVTLCLRPFIPERSHKQGMDYTFDNCSRPQLIPWYFGCTILIIFAYTLCSKYTKYNWIIICSFYLLFIIFALCLRSLVYSTLFCFSHFIVVLISGLVGLQNFMDSAGWTGLAILLLLYFHLITVSISCASTLWQSQAPDWQPDQTIKLDSISDGSISIQQNTEVSEPLEPNLIYNESSSVKNSVKEIEEGTME